MATKDDMLVDKRIIDRNIDKGLLSREEYAKYLEALPDVADNAEYVAIDEPQEDAAQTPAAEEPQA